MPTQMADLEPTFDLPAGSSSDFYLSREINDHEDDNNGRVLKKHGLWDYPFLTRRTGDGLAGTNEELTSSEFRHGRTASKVKLGAASSSGNLDIEFSPETFDDQLEGVFRDKWIRWFQDGKKDLITKDYMTPKGFIHVNGDDGTYNQWYDETLKGKRVSQVPLLFTGDEAGTAQDPYGLIKVSADKIGKRTKNPLGKFVAHELHIGNTPVKYAAMSRIPITDSAVRYQNFRHVEMGELNLNVTVNAIVTGSFSMNGSNNPDYFTERQETGKTRMAEEMADKKSVAAYGGTGDEEDYFSTDCRDAAEKFIAAAKSTVKSTETDQFTAMDGFLYVNGHQLQFCSGLTMDLNNNLQAIYAIFVKNAIANLSPSLAVTGNITAYFTDGERDSTGRKYGADDLKNLASQNKDAEILYAFIDKEDPDIIYLFQIFKATISAPTETKDAEQPISLDLPYTSYGEMAVRCLRLEIPKIRKIKFDVEDALEGVRGEGTDTVKLTLYPSVPLDRNQLNDDGSGNPVYVDGEGDPVYTDADYVDADNTNGLYVFGNAEVHVIDSEGNSTQDDGAQFLNARIDDDGAIQADLKLSSDIVEGDSIKVRVVVNGDAYESSATIEQVIPYMRMGDAYKEASYSNGYVAVQPGDTINVFTEAASSGPAAERNLLYRSVDDLVAGDIKVSSSDEALVSVSGTTITVAAGASEGASAEITISSATDKTTDMTFTVKVAESEPVPAEAETPDFTNVLADVSYTQGDTATALDGTATVSDGGTVTYQWYTTSGGTDTALTGETGATFTPPTDDVGAVTYKVVATNTLGTDTATAEQTVTVTVTE